MLGDVGGLFGSLTFLSSIYISLVEFIIGSRLNQFLTAQLYKIERKKVKYPFNLDISETLKSIRKRKPAVFALSSLILSCFDSRKKHY